MRGTPGGRHDLAPRGTFPARGCVMFGVWPAVSFVRCIASGVSGLAYLVWRIGSGSGRLPPGPSPGGMPWGRCRQGIPPRRLAVLVVVGVAAVVGMPHVVAVRLVGVDVLVFVPVVPVIVPGGAVTMFVSVPMGMDVTVLVGMGGAVGMGVFMHVGMLVGVFVVVPMFTALAVGVRVAVFARFAAGAAIAGLAHGAPPHEWALGWLGRGADQPCKPPAERFDPAQPDAAVHTVMPVSSRVKMQQCGVATPALLRRGASTCCARCPAPRPP